MKNNIFFAILDLKGSNTKKTLEIFYGIVRKNMKTLSLRFIPSTESDFFKSLKMMVLTPRKKLLYWFINVFPLISHRGMRGCLSALPPQLCHVKPNKEKNSMDKTVIIQKLEQGVSSLREHLEKSEGSTISAVSEGAKSAFDSARDGFESLKTSIMGNETAKKALENVKQYLDDLEKAVKEGDKKMSAKAMDVLEKAVKDLKEKHEDKK